MTCVLVNTSHWTFNMKDSVQATSVSADIFAEAADLEPPSLSLLIGSYAARPAHFRWMIVELAEFKPLEKTLACRGQVACCWQLLLPTFCSYLLLLCSRFTLPSTCCPPCLDL